MIFRNQLPQIRDRAHALEIWDRLVELDPGFFDGYPREQGKAGPFDEDERVQIIMESVEILGEDLRTRVLS